MKIYQDLLLFERLKKGDRQSFNTLFRKYYQQMCRYAFGYLRSVDMAGEMVQDVFLSLWYNKDELVINKSFVAFLYACVRNQCLNEIEREKTRKRYEVGYQERLENAEELSDEEDNSLKNAIQRCIKKLPEKCRNIFIMSKNEGLSYNEIAVFLEVSEKTVENQMGIAFKKMRECLKPRLSII